MQQCLRHSLPDSNTTFPANGHAIRSSARDTIHFFIHDAINSPGEYQYLALSYIFLRCSHLRHLCLPGIMGYRRDSFVIEREPNCLDGNPAPVQSLVLPAMTTWVGRAKADPSCHTLQIRVVLCFGGSPLQRSASIFSTSFLNFLGRWW